MTSLLTILAAVVVGTWNGNWFPSGRAEHRAHPEVERATIGAAAEMLARGLGKIDPEGKHDIILCLNEIRGPKVASNLIERIGRPSLRVVAVSGYRRRDRFDQQQDVIATTLPVAQSKWRNWSVRDGIQPPRGYAFAALVISPAVTAAVYAAHLKSNYGQGKNPQTAELNRRKREVAIRQIVENERSRSRRVIVAGDMNADRWKREFARERIFEVLDEAGFLNLLSLLPPPRGTYKGPKRYGDSALDYVFTRGFDSVAVPVLMDNDGLSDHRALFTLVSP